MTVMDDDAIRAIFFVECEEQLAILDSGLRAFSVRAFDAETVNSVFRAVHSIKGGAGIFGFHTIIEFSHTFESILDLLRSGQIQIDDATVEIFYRSMDCLSDLICRADQNLPASPAQTSLLHELRTLIPADDDARGIGSEPGGMDFVFEPVAIDFAAFGRDTTPDASCVGISAGWHVSFVPKQRFYDHGHDANSYLRMLQDCALCEIRVDTSSVPPLDTLDPFQSYLSWEIHLDRSASDEVLRDVFDWAGDTAEVSIIDLRRSSVIDEPRTTACLTPSEKLVVDGAILPPLPRARPQPTLRVDLSRVDDLINLVGELVICSASLRDRLSRTRDSRINNEIDTLNRLTHDLQEKVLSVRAQPIHTVFQRLERLVREIAPGLDKKVRLTLHGSETELDRTIIEHISEPLTHMLRNSLDHGIEHPDDRLAAGKDPCGTIHLSACHRSGRVIIEVRDDGAGIAREKLHHIAAQKGLIGRAPPLTESELDALIFLPGLSTRKTVTDVSGRGVGMDAVKDSIAHLGGRITVSSRPGEGTHFTISLPLTLAVMDGMATSVGQQTLIVPMNTIVETLRPTPCALTYLCDRAAVLNLRGTYLPVIDIGTLLGFRETRIDPTQAVAMIVEIEAGARIALIVDVALNTLQCVIKSLEDNYRKIVGIAAATIMGDGTVGLILDVDAIYKLSTDNMTRHDTTAALKAL